MRYKIEFATWPTRESYENVFPRNGFKLSRVTMGIKMNARTDTHIWSLDDFARTWRTKCATLCKRHFSWIYFVFCGFFKFNQSSNAVYRSFGKCACKFIRMSPSNDRWRLGYIYRFYLIFLRFITSVSLYFIRCNWRLVDLLVLSHFTRKK